MWSYNAMVEVYLCPLEVCTGPFFGPSPSSAYFKYYFSLAGITSVPILLLVNQCHDSTWRYMLTADSVGRLQSYNIRKLETRSLHWSFSPTARPSTVHILSVAFNTLNYSVCINLWRTRCQLLRIVYSQVTDRKCQMTHRTINDNSVVVKMQLSLSFWLFVST